MPKVTFQPAGRAVEVAPGTSILESLMLTQKWGVTDFRSLSTTQTTPMLRIASSLARCASGRPGMSLVT